MSFVWYFFGDGRDNCFLLTEKGKLRASLGKRNGKDLEIKREKMLTRRLFLVDKKTRCLHSSSDVLMKLVLKIVGMRILIFSFLKK